MTRVREKSLSEEATLVVALEGLGARSGLVLSILEDPLLFVSESFSEEHDQEGASSHALSRSGRGTSSSSVEGGRKGKERKSFGPKKKGLEQGNEAETEELPNDLVLEHGEFANDLPAVVLTTGEVASAAIEVEGHARAPESDAEGEEKARGDSGSFGEGGENGRRRRGIGGAGNDDVDPSVDDREDRPTAIDPAVVLGDFGESVSGDSDEETDEEGGDECVRLGAEDGVHGELENGKVSGRHCSAVCVLNTTVVVALLESVGFSGKEFHLFIVCYFFMLFLLII